MDGKLTFTILLIVGLAIAPATATAQENPNFDVIVPEPTLTPGQSTHLSLLVTNDADEVDDRVKTAENVEVELHAGETPITVQSGPRLIGQMADGDTREVAFRVTVPQNIESGTYKLSLSVTYEFEDERQTQTVDATVRVEDRARFDVVAVSTNVSVGSTGTYEVSVRNVGSGTASAATLRLNSRSGDVTFGRATGDSRVLGTLAPGETATVKYTVSVAESAVLQPYALTASFSYEDESGIAKSAPPQTIELTPEPEQRFIVVEVSTNVSIGDTDTLTVSLQNRGQKVSDAEVTLESRSSYVTFGASATDTRFVGTWAAGETRSVEYKVTVSPQAATQSYGLAATVAYENREGFRARAGPTPLGVAPDPAQSFSVAAVNATLRVGEEGTLRGELVNTGVITARNVVVTLQPAGPNVNVLEPEYAIGDLSAGEQVPFSLSLEISEAADDGPRQFSVVVRYRGVDDNVRRSDPLDMRVQVAQKRDVFAIDPVSTSLEAGSGGTITVQITNQGDEPVTDVSAKMFADDPLSTTDDEVFIDALAPGESQQVVFGLSAGGGALPKTYPVSVDFQYVQTDGDTIVSSSYKVPIKIKPPSDNGGLPASPLLIGAVIVLVLLLGGGYYRYRRR